MSEGFGFLRQVRHNFLAGDDDIFVPQNLIRNLELRDGSEIKGQAVPSRKQGRGNQLHEVTTVNGLDPEQARNVKSFKLLTSVDPEPKFNLQTDDNDVCLRVIDLISPIGRGQRALIVAPPRTGKTILLQKIANAIVRNHPEVHLMMVLIDERPEEVTDMKRNIKGEVISSSSDSYSRGHVQVAEMVLERARRLVEVGKDVVMFLDSLTRLGRAYNLETGNSGRTLSGGLDARTMEKPRELFGSARNAEEGGSLTIVATALIDTGSRMDQVIFEEFKGTGNMELVLSRQLADRRIFPAIDINPSGTRREERLRDAEELKAVWMLRRVLNQLKPLEAMELLIDKLGKVPTNAEFLGRFQARASSMQD
jgi:transcription termination factor Rho